MNGMYCEFTDGAPACGVAAAWVVQVGTRKSDRQLSCGRHLHRTCLAMAEAEAPRYPSLTVTPIGKLTRLTDGVGA